VSQRGLLDLGFRSGAGRVTQLVRRRQRFPLRMTVPMYLDGDDRAMAFVIVQNPTGGVFAGDRLEIDVAAGEAARVHLRTQSATKLYAMEGGAAEQSLRFEVAPGAYVEYLPDPVIPQAGSRLTQRTTVAAATGGVFFTAETVAAGRVARGERFAYDRIRLETRIEVDGAVVAIDVLDLEPHRRWPGLPGMLDGADHLSSVLCVCPGADTAGLAGRVDGALAAVVGERGAAGILPGGAGVVARILSPTAISARVAVHLVWDLVRRELAGARIPARVA